VKKIDLKDRKILFELDQNSRQSLSQIGKKVGLAKSIVAYRIKRLTKMNIIKSFYTVVDLYKLGFIAPRFHLVFQYITPEIQKEIIDYFINSKYTFIVVSCYGPFDLSVLFGLRDIRKLYLIWQEIQSKFGYYFEKQSLAFYLNETHLQPLYLINETVRKKSGTISVRNPHCDAIILDDIELKILNALSNNAQMSLTVLSKHLKLTSRQISYRIKKMVDIGVIEGFRTEIDITKLGYHSYKVYVFLKEFNIRNKIINYLYSNPNLVCIDTTTGESHLELEFHLENVDRLHTIMQDISEKFPNAIRNYQYASVKEINKWLYLPTIGMEKSDK
jgi:Lrp/AsnC family leucine-responsive transcriptional regulator